jgi:hypothetical protein
MDKEPGDERPWGEVATMRGEFHRCLAGKAVRRVADPGEDSKRPEAFKIEFEDGTVLYISRNGLELHPPEDDPDRVTT